MVTHHFLGGDRCAHRPEEEVKIGRGVALKWQGKKPELTKDFCGFQSFQIIQSLHTSDKEPHPPQKKHSKNFDFKMLNFFIQGKKNWKCKNVSGVVRVVQKTDAQEESKNIAVEAF